VIIDSKKLPGSDRFPIRVKGLSCLKNVHKAFQDIRGFNKIFSVFDDYMINIVQVGAGGTGGYVFAEMMRYISNLPEHIKHRIHYTLCDGDKFESKNIKRQLCSEEDVGRNKAESLVENCVETYGINSLYVQAYPYYIKNIRQLQDLSFGIPFVYNCRSSELHRPREEETTRRLSRIENNVRQEYRESVKRKIALHKDLVEEFSYAKNKFFRADKLAMDNDNPLALRGYSLSDITKTVNINPENETATSMSAYDISGNADPYSDASLGRISSLVCGKYRVNTYFSNHELDEAFNDTSKFKFLEDKYCDINRMYGRRRIIIPILIDCVDKTTVRNIINAFFKSWNRLPSIDDVYYESLVTEFSCVHETSDFFTIDDGFLNEFHDLMADNCDTKYNLVLTDVDRLSITKEVNGTDVFSNIAKKISYDTSYCGLVDNAFSYINESRCCCVREMYLISSGNGEYTGQVAWGRVCQQENASSPVCYKDIFGEEDRVGSTFSKDQCTEIAADRTSIIDKFSVETSDPSVECSVPTVKIAEGFKLKANYKLPYTTIQRIFKNKYVNERELNTSLTSENNNSFYSAYVDYAGKVGILDILNKANMVSNYGYNARVNHIRNVDHNYTDFITRNVPDTNVNKAFMGVASKETRTFSTYLNALNGKPLPWEFKNFDDWMGQYLSVPIPYSIFPELIDIEEDLKEEQMSCAERAVQNVQSMQANKTAANLVVNFMVQILDGLTNGGSIMPIASVYFDTRENLYSPTYITTDYLKSDKYEADETLDDLKVVYELEDPKELYLARKRGSIKEVYSSTTSASVHAAPYVPVYMNADAGHRQ